MINTSLVLVFCSAYTFAVSKTTVPRQGPCLDAHSCKERVSKGVMLALLLAGPAHIWCDDTTETPILHLMEEFPNESFRDRRDRFYRLRHRP